MRADRDRDAMRLTALAFLASLRPCAPSGADHILREGTLQPGAVAAPPRLVFVHIPRAAGGSSMNAAPSVLPKGTTLLGSAESAAWSRLTRERLGDGGRRVTMLRFPLSLALSQFLYCKFQLRRRKGRGRFPNRDPGRPRAPTGGLDEWAAHFPSDTSYGCYDPTNVQYRFVAGNGNARGAGGGLVTMLRFPLSLALSQFLYCKFQLRRRKGRGRFPNRDPGRPRAPTGGLDEWAAHFPADTSYGCYDPTNVQYRFVAGNGNARGAGGVAARMTIDKAVKFLDDEFYFVGLVELHAESLCALAHATTGRVPAHCGCGVDAPARRATHGKIRKLQNVTAAGLAPAQRDALARITAKDLVLYARALLSFERRVADVRARTGVSLVCDGKFDALWATTLEYACAGAAAHATRRVLHGSDRRCS